MALPGTRTVKILINGDASGLDKASKDAESKLSRFEGKMTALSTGILGAAAAGVAGLAALGDQLDSAYDRIRIDTGKTGAELDALEGSFKKVAKTVPAEFDQVAAAIAKTSQVTGAQGETLEDLSTQYLNLARLTGGDVVTSIKAGSDALKAWQIPTKNQGEFLDQLYNASVASGQGFDQFAGTLQKFAPTLRNAGFSIQTSIPLIAQLEKSGANTEKVLGALSIGAGKLAKEGKNTQAGVQSLLETIKNAPNATKAAELAVDAFGAKAGPTLADAIRKGQLSITDMQNTLADSGGAINDAAADTDDWKESLLKLKNEAILALEGPATKVFNFISEKGVPALKSAFDWAEKNTGTLKALGIAFGAIAVTVLTVTAGLKAYHAIMAVIRALTIAWTAVQWLLNVALNANPIGLIVLAIVALIAIGILLWKNWDKIVAALGVAWEWLKEKIFAVGRWFRDVFWGQWIKPIWDKFTDHINKIVDMFKKIPDKLSSLGRAIASPFLWAFNKIADLWNSTLGSFAVTIPSWVPGIGGNTLALPKMPKLAFMWQGGELEGGHPAIVGERGPELWIPKGSGTVVPNHALAGGGDTYVQLVVGDQPLTEYVKIAVDRVGRKTVRRVVATRPRPMGAMAA